ncbi:uncharacterized protein I303_100615 [Kwoniella dejecticola CBS 10117]|uniref:Phytase n=1 Tax=Kwoniella dejecticola CBS 10117 TaxID=1296121 RepID=A0A1A6AFG7_9TREE|nr:uncharacterized protein I303_00618 [Kwoniella dejecticola CBS 10117]OBR88801.1 hypothetical protein I303_00618 [Kwoniella dejecticola CBS 10117]
MYAPAPAGRASDRTPLLRPMIATIQHPSHRHHNRRRGQRRPIPLFSILFTTSILVIVSFLAWDVSTYGRCHVKPLCRALSGKSGLEQTWWRNQGPYSPFKPLGPGGGNKGLPKGCELSQVTILHRHAARYPTAGAGQCILSALRKIDNREVTMPRRHPEFSFLFKEDLKLKDWRFDELMDQGRKQSWLSGRALKQQYGQFLRHAAEGIFTRSSGGGRVVETAGYWLEGFRGDRFKLKDSSILPQVDVVIPEGEEYNNTLSVHSCPAFQNLDPKPSQLKFTDLSPLFEPALNRLNTVLRPRPALEMDDLVCLADMCGYDSQSRGVDWQEWSKWCGIFTKAEWEIFGHAKDLKRWYDLGENSQYGPTMGAGYVNELLARLTDSEVIDNTTTNHTLDGDERTFPRGGKRFFVDFGHDNEMLETIAALGLLPQHRPLPTTSVPPKRTYILSRIVPFGARIAFERVSCKMGNWEPDPEAGENADEPDRGNDGKRDYIRILINDKIESSSHPSCEFSGLANFGLCELDSFVDSQLFSRELVDWSICYENGTQTG